MSIGPEGPPYRRRPFRNRSAASDFTRFTASPGRERVVGEQLQALDLVAQAGGFLELQVGGRRLIAYCDWTPRIRYAPPPINSRYP
jgi:hypothetical protein